MTTDHHAPPASTSVRAVLDLDRPGHRISRHVYGHFAEHLGRCIYDGFFVGADSAIPNEGGIRLDVVDALRALQIPNLRWPGGCFADEYHWRDGVGPRELRPRMVNSHWGDVVEDNSFGTHEFLALCELLGTEPYVSANVGSGTVREMSDWVEYLTRADDSPMAALRREHGRDEPWPVRFWGLGNEPWGCGGNMRAEYYADLARQFGTYCRDHGENRLFRIAAGAADADYRWTETLMKALGRELGAPGRPRHGGGTYQAVSFHYYTVPGPWDHKGSATEFDLTEYYLTLREARRIEQILAGHAAVMDAYDPAREIGLVLDEWGTWFDVEAGTNPGFLFQQNTLRDALVAGVHFDAFHAHADRLVMANIAQTVNVLQAMILTDGEAMVLTPTYHVFEMNKGHHDARVLPLAISEVTTRDVEGTDLELVSASASTSGDAVLISLTNLDAERGVELAVELRGGRVGDPVGRLLAAAEVNAHNTAAAPAAVEPAVLTDVRLVDGSLRVTLPPHSFATVALTVQG